MFPATHNPAPPKNVFSYQHPQQPTQTVSHNLSAIDDSLTDIRWLRTMDAQFPSLDNVEQRCGVLSRSATKGRICKKLSYDKKSEGKNEPDNIRPPFSYAALIALAINSHHQKMLTLNSIYLWIEDNFPFFRMPEARAWKNSIRHNLSIKKNMFQKVFIDPPRRGNGAYWTLLPEGTEEVERCMKLLKTLRPPVIDPSSVYLMQGSSSFQVMRTRGKFVPSCPDEFSSEELVKIKSEAEKENVPKSIDPPPARLVHPLEQAIYPQAYPPSIQPYNPSDAGFSNKPSSSQSISSSNVFDLSFFTPLKDDSLLQNVTDLNGISLSPLFTYLTPKATGASQTPNKPMYQGSPLSTPLKPFNHFLENDSGVFMSPGLKFNTPVKDLNDFLHTCTPIKQSVGYFQSTPIKLTDLRSIGGSL